MRRGSTPRPIITTGSDTASSRLACAGARLSDRRRPYIYSSEFSTASRFLVRSTSHTFSKKRINKS
jgi:hypothetical protein